MDSHDPFRTTDLDLAAFLICRGIPLQSTLKPERVSGVRPLVEFVFGPCEGFWDALRAWGESGDGRLVDARDFAKVRFRLYRDARDLMDGLPGRNR